MSYDHSWPDKENALKNILAKKKPLKIICYDPSWKIKCTEKAEIF